jgi:hypothetical protein
MNPNSRKERSYKDKIQGIDSQQLIVRVSF